jgi:flagellar protein FlaG
MAIESINTQSKITVPPAAGFTGAGSGEIPVRLKSPPAGNGVVHLVSQRPKPASENTAGSAEQVSAMVEDLQTSLEMLQQKHTQLNFSVHEKTDRVMVRITDQSSGDVIREIPSEEFLDMAAKLQEMVGLMFDAKI